MESTGKIESIKELITEWGLTLSSKKGLLSSKRIERFIAFTLACLIIFIYFIVKVFCLVECNMTATDVILLSGALFTYGGFSMVKTEQSKKSLQSPKEEEIN